MIEIEGPDGVIYEFPQGTDDATIKTAMGKVYGAPQSTAGAAVPGVIPAPTEIVPERGLGAKLYDNIIGSDDGVQSYGESLGTWLNRAGESATLGLVGDEAAAFADDLVGRGDYDERLNFYRQNEANMSPGGRLSADIVGALVPTLTGAGAIGSVSSVPARMGIGAGLGAASGASIGFMEGEGGFDDRLEGAGMQGVVGGLLGGAIPAVGAGVRGVMQGRAARRAVREAARDAPTSEALRAEGNALYRQVDDAGVHIRPDAFNYTRSGILEALRSNTGYDQLPGPGSLTPNSARVMQIMDEEVARMNGDPTAALPFKSLDQMRRQAGAAAGNVLNPVDQKAGVQIIQELDDFVQRLGPDDVVSGDVEALKTAIPKAREVWNRMSKSQLLDDAMERSENYLSGSASGVRNGFRSILNNRKLAARFNDAEKAALRMVTHGSMLDQMINLAGGGLGQLGSIGLGAASNGIVGGLIGAAAAAGQRKLSEAVVMRNAELARAAIASGALRRGSVNEAIANAGRPWEALTNTGLLSGLLAAHQTQ